MNTYKNGPEGMPRVERMTDSTIGSLYLSVRHIDHATEREIAFAHAAAEEVLARLPAWPTPGTGTTASAAGVSMADIGKAAMDWSEKYSSAFRATRENAPAAWDGLMKLVRAYGAALAEEARREAKEEIDRIELENHRLRAEVISMRTAGGDAEKVDHNSDFDKACGAFYREHGRLPAPIEIFVIARAAQPVAEAAAQADAYWCVICERAIAPEQHKDGNIYVHDDKPHPEMTFDEQENPQ